MIGHSNFKNNSEMSDCSDRNHIECAVLCNSIKTGVGATSS